MPAQISNVRAQPMIVDTRAELNALLDEDLAATLRRNPITATVRGIPGYNDLLPDMSLAELDREHARERRTLERLKALDAKSFTGQDRISYELLLNKMEVAVDAQEFVDAEALVLSTLGGLQTMMPRAAQVTPFRKADDYRDYVKRIRAMPKLVDDTIERLKPGMASRWMSTKPVLDRINAAIDAHLVENVDTSPLLSPFARMADGISDTDRAALLADARRAVADEYQPALRRFKAFTIQTYRPKAPEAAGLAAYPGGARYYDYLIRARIIRGTSAEEIHALGLAEVKRLRTEIGGIAKEVGFQGTTDEFIAHLRSEPKYFFDSADAVLAAYRGMPARVDPQLRKLFHAIPRMHYAVRAMSPAEAASSTAANYQVGSLTLGTSAYFTVNALGYASEAKWRTETLFLHEAVPGHHMQIARAAEIEGLHPWRSQANFNAVYAEGWALYAEELGYDLGFFKDPYQRYGHRQAQLFRAARLVVDTGIHHYNWSRDKAIEYMANEGGLDRDFAISEVDRYSSNPGQALSYLMGYRKIRDLRTRAEKSLGPRFDIRDFHAVLIDNGSMPLAVLEKVVDEWIARGGGANKP
ncbi:MAG TPA: DUF885 domain-containing protein [Casimicrobiaceae bacterium]|nr:DUF885 domain-containing protein [Casimicrobiaceae bacterium]